MLNSSDFPLFYKAQDLYFFADPQDQVLVPDSVFVPLGTTDSQVLDNLVRALIAGPRDAVAGGRDRHRAPVRYERAQCHLDGSTVTVNLVGTVSRPPPRRSRCSPPSWSGR